MRILLIEDDKDVAGYVVRVLSEAGHICALAADGMTGLTMAHDEDFDVLVVDRMIPKPDGLAVIRTLRASGNEVPILVLSALAQVGDRVTGLKAGADDYLVKPFAATELLARLEALFRRRVGGGGEETILRVADLEMNLLSRRVSRAGHLIDLKPREFRLLEYLIRNAGHVVTRTMLLENVWDYNFDPQTNVIDVHISRLRQKIDRGHDPALIETVRGAGYAIRTGDASA